MRVWLLGAFILFGLSINSCTKSEDATRASSSGATSQPASAGNPAGGGGSRAKLEAPSLPTGIQAIVSIGDVHGFFDGLGQIARSIEPSMNGEGLRNQLGMMVGDPGLAAFAGGGVAVVAFGPTDFAVMAPMPAEAAPGYTQMVQSFQMQARHEDGWFIAAQAEPSLETAKGMTEVVQKHLSSSGPKFQVAGRVADLIAPFDSRIQLMIGSLGQMMAELGQPQPGSELGLKFFEAEVRGYYSTLKQMDVLDISLDANAKGLSVGMAFTGRPGTGLAKLLAKNSTPFDLEVFGRLSGQGAIRGGFRMDLKSCLDFLTNELKSAFGEMNYQSEGLDRYLAWMQGWSDMFGNEFAGDMMIPGQKIVSGSAIWQVRDAEEAIQMMAGMEKDLAEGGAAHALYAEFGQEVSLKFVRDARESAGTKVHKMQMSMDMGDSVPQEQRELFNQMLGNLEYELADLGGGLVGVGMTPEATDALIAGTGGGGELQAVQDFGPGGVGYADVSLAAFLQTLRPVIQQLGGTEEAPMDQILAMLEGVPPITFGLFSDGTTGKVAFSIPADLIAKLAMLGTMVAPSPEPK